MSKSSFHGKYNTEIEGNWTKYLLPKAYNAQYVAEVMRCNFKPLSYQQYRPRSLLYKAFYPQASMIIGDGQVKDDLYRKECLDTVKHEKRFNKEKKKILHTYQRVNRNATKDAKLRAWSYQGASGSKESGCTRNVNDIFINNSKGSISNGSRKKGFFINHSNNLIFIGRSIKRIWNHHFIKQIPDNFAVVEAKSSILLHPQTSKDEKQYFDCTLKTSTLNDNVLNVIKKQQFPRPIFHDEVEQREEDLCEEQEAEMKARQERRIFEISNYMAILHSNKYKVVLRVY